MFFNLMKRVLEFGSLAKNNGAIEMNAATYINPTNRFTKIRHDLLPVFGGFLWYLNGTHDTKHTYIFIFSWLLLCN